MKLKEKIKNIKWLIEHKKDLEKIVKSNTKTKDYAIGGVPSFQKEYVSEILKEIEKD
jgi:hypothetical protein